jgi:phosphate/sulfate permease
MDGRFARIQMQDSIAVAVKQQPTRYHRAREFASPAYAAGATYVGLEVAKKIKPSLVDGKEAKQAFWLPMVGAALLKAAGVGAFATVGWVPLLLNMLMGTIIAKPTHDALAPVVDPYVKTSKAGS